MDEIQKLSMEFDVNTLDHLGVRLYKQYPPIIAELVSNSWDADAQNVDIKLYSGENSTQLKIIVSDDGSGMSYEELQNNFLKIGRNRRISDPSAFSPIFHRKVVGKKGIGKLSMFGLANLITVKTVKDNIKNVVDMRYSDIKNCNGNKYYPTEITKNEPVDEANGTEIMLSEIKRTNSFQFDCTKLGIELSKRFSIFGKENNFISNIYLNDELILNVDNSLKYSEIKNEFIWEIPEYIKDIDTVLYEYLKEKGINGNVFTSKNTLSQNFQGITLLVRKKLAEENTFFTDRAKDYFHNYCYGFLNIDFIDENDNDDFISTDRKSILWEESITIELREKLLSLMNRIQADWRNKREAKKRKEIEDKSKININQWILELNPVDRKLAANLVDSVVKDSSLDVDKSALFINHITDVFSYETFKNLAAELLESGNQNSAGMLKIISDWDFIESKEMAKIASGRINTIKNFKKLIENNESETKAIQPFFETFPWILDPKMTSFERELTLSRAIKEGIIDKEAKKYGANVLKRMDFFVSQNENTYRIFELKRPDTNITDKMIDNIKEYILFTKKFFITNNNIQNQSIKVILVTNRNNFNPKVAYEIDSMQKTGDLILRSYNELLVQAENYNKEFIKRYEEISAIKRKSLA